MIIATVENIPDKKVEKILGIVKGSTIRAKWFGKDIMASIRNLVGGELVEYTEMMNEARLEAEKRMLLEAKKLKADAIVGLRYFTAEVVPGAAEIMVYGTAVKLK
jgi:uncharacterized protein YbjQ (UPF0145 family)